MALDRGVFTLSLDFELIWGTQDLAGPNAFRRACIFEREQIIDDLLALLHEFEIPATWCTVGHLFLDSCDGRHAELKRPAHAWLREDWFHHDPGGKESKESVFLGKSLVEKILACPTKQEIGFHSFSHVIWGDPGCSQEVVDSEMKACLQASAWTGARARSFAFPRNRVGHLPVLAANGIRVFRGPGPRWYERDENPGPLGRLVHLLEVAIGTAAPTVLPETTPEGLVNLPGSMIYLPAHGPRALIPVGRRVRRALGGLEQAVAQKAVFHLWFHPTNLADHYLLMMAGLRSVFDRVRNLRNSGRLDVRVMGSFARAA
ncbi:MAG: polysaccharide deacetylase family protein [Fimbriimonadaceae bacterium]|nr:polysaccharide deacetylase family protein [Fimbriimonadaceae bacterium]